MIRVGINGMGRMGRAYLRFAESTEDIEVVAVNDVADATTIARLLRRDSTFGPFGTDVIISGDYLLIGGRKVAVTAGKQPADLPWSEHGVDVVIESTGKFRTREAAAGHLAAGAAKVLISAPGKGVDATIVMGVNDAAYDPARHHGDLQRLVHDQLRGPDGQGAATTRSASSRGS